MVTEIRWPSCSPGPGISLADDEVHVWSASLDHPPVSADALCASLSDQERLRARRWRFEKDRRRSIASRGLLRWLLAYYLDVEPGSVALRQGAQGKPALADAPRLRFSVAHSGDLVLYAFARHDELGVDVERVRAIPDALSIAASFFAPGERDALRAVAAAGRPYAFLVYWTRKEAYVKASGVGLSHRLDGVEVSLGQGAEASRRRIPVDSSIAADWRIHHLDPAVDFVAALALPNPWLRVRCRHWASAAASSPDGRTSACAADHLTGDAGADKLHGEGGDDPL